MSIVNIHNLEIHVTHFCNLKCEGCTHYSNYGHTGNLTPSRAKQWFSLWNKRINPQVFSLLGGEPTLNPNFEEIILLARKYWPSAQLRIVTNGFYLHRHPELPKTLSEVGNTVLYLSIHHNDPKYLKRMRPIMRLIKRWNKWHNTRVVVMNSYNWWEKTYKGSSHHEMEPFEDMQPRRSWEKCISKKCPQLHEGKIWKCPQLAYLGMQNAKYNLSSKWEPYLKYQPLSPECSDKELKVFFSLEEEDYCGMCAAEPRKFMPSIPISR